MDSQIMRRVREEMTKGRKHSSVIERYFRIKVNPKGEGLINTFDGEGIREFIDTLQQQAVKDIAIIEEERGRILGNFNLNNTDLEAIGRYDEASERERYSIKLSKRAIRAIPELRKARRFFEHRLNVLQMLSPHTFCQIENPLSASEIERIMRYITTQGSYGEPSGGWMRTRPLPIPVMDSGNLKVDVMGYLHTEKERLKVKIHCRNTQNGLDDKLDLETLFSGNEFVGIVHYDVERPYTTSVLVKEGVMLPEEVKVTALDVSRNPDNRAIMINMGEGKKRTHIDELGKNFVAGTYEFWKNHPNVLGGPLAKQIIAAAQTYSRVPEIQREAARRN